MSRRVKITLDHAGMESVLKSDSVAGEIRAAAEARAAETRNHPEVKQHGVSGSVEVEDYVTDRAASMVVIKHAGGLGLEGKYGVLGPHADPK